MSEAAEPMHAEIVRACNALGIWPVKVTFVRMAKVMLTMDEIEGGVRVIYSQGFLDMVRRVEKEREMERRSAG